LVPPNLAAVSFSLSSGELSRCVCLGQPSNLRLSSADGYPHRGIGTMQCSSPMTCEPIWSHAIN
jgi:hypothetical protein